MPRLQKPPLRSLTAHERTTLKQGARSGADRADRGGRAKALLAVADGAACTAAAQAAGRRSGDGVAHLSRLPKVLGTFQAANRRASSGVKEAKNSWTASSRASTEPCSRLAATLPFIRHQTFSTGLYWCPL